MAAFTGGSSVSMDGTRSLKAGSGVSPFGETVIGGGPCGTEGSGRREEARKAAEDAPN